MYLINNLNLDHLLSPISDASPTGTDLRNDQSKEHLYYKVRDARSLARQIERQNTQNGNNAKTDWKEVISLSMQILADHSKDFEIATWLIEGLFREHGFAGLHDGFMLLHEMIIKFWDNLYPAPDEEGLSSKIAALTALNGENSDGTLIVPIAMQPLVSHPSIGSFALWQYQQALEVHRISDKDKKAERLAKGAVSFESIQAAVRESSLIELNKLQKEIIECSEMFSKLDSLLSEKCGIDAPPTSRIHAQLIACNDCLKSLLSDHIEVSIFEPIEPVEKQITASNLEQGSHKAISSREQALSHLLNVAEFFRKTEPHSPISYVLERAVRWGRLPLPELLRELVLDEKARAALCDLTGITV